MHVERAIQRMKVFKVLRGPVPWEMVGALDEVFVVIAGIANLHAGIVNLHSNVWSFRSLDPV